MLLRLHLLFFSLLFSKWGFAQPSYHFSLKITPESCLKGTASLEISGTEQKDSIIILWSSGQVNTLTANALLSGSYYVQTKIIHQHDSVKTESDSTLYFTVEKTLCGVLVDNYFSPNDDGYHDVLGIVNYQFYPNFEFVVFNKWGQKVHSQKSVYIPWDGKWNGAELPDGSYYYIFFFDASDKGNMVKGDINILR